MHLATDTIKVKRNNIAIRIGKWEKEKERTWNFHVPDLCMSCPSSNTRIRFYFHEHHRLGNINFPTVNDGVWQKWLTISAYFPTIMDDPHRQSIDLIASCNFFFFCTVVNCISFVKRNVRRCYEIFLWVELVKAWAECLLTFPNVQSARRSYVN